MSLRAPVGDLNFAPVDVCIGRGLSAITAKNGDNNFLFYALKYNIKALINQSNGTTYESVTGDIVKNMKLIVPDSETDRERISSLLFAIDTKIENNNKINAELESMAKTIYDYWFLQFDFPDENGRPYKSSGGKMVWNEELKREIPEGWEVKSVFSAMDVTYGFPLSTDSFDESEKENCTPVIRIRDILNNSISAYTIQKVENKFLTKKKDLLVGMDGNFHMNFWSEDGDCVNQRIVRIRDKEQVSALQIYYEIKPFIKAREENVARSTVGHLSDKDLKTLRVCCTHNIRIYKTFDTILEKICHSRQENQKLASLRDFLLPLLMNGQVTIKKDEK